MCRTGTGMSSSCPGKKWQSGKESGKGEYVIINSDSPGVKGLLVVMYSLLLAFFMHIEIRGSCYYDGVRHQGSEVNTLSYSVGSAAPDTPARRRLQRRPLDPPPRLQLRLILRPPGRL